MTSNCPQVCQFQRLCFKHWQGVEAMQELALSHCGAVEARDTLRCGLGAIARAAAPGYHVKRRRHAAVVCRYGL